MLGDEFPPQAWEEGPEDSADGGSGGARGRWRRGGCCGEGYDQGVRKASLQLFEGALLDLQPESQYTPPFHLSSLSFALLVTTNWVTLSCFSTLSRPSSQH